MLETMPPRVLFVYAPLGGGHTSVVRALSQVLEEHCEVQTLNAFSKGCSQFPLTTIPFLYRFFTVRQPWLWWLLYHGTHGPRKFALAERLAQPFLRHGLRHSLASWPPDIVVSVFPALGNSLARALATLGSAVPLLTVVTDLVTVHPAWVSTACHAYSVPTQAAADACAGAGIPRERIHVFGLPVAESPRTFLARETLRERLGLDPLKPTILLMGGSEGSGRLESLLCAFAQADQKPQLAVITGRNRRLKRRLEDRHAGPTCQVLGYVENVWEWMRVSDLLITRAGPSTVMEALHAGLPMLLTESLPQEAGTIEYLLAHGAARFAAHPTQIVAAALELLRQPDSLEALRCRGRLLVQHDATRALATFIRELAHGGRETAAREAQ